ncbi:MAG: hypothetical protein KGJ06_02360 [Pseudomonadota bacterium]|nr:hypothetical protein [Pseudomonadota bacterium]
MVTAISSFDPLAYLDQVKGIKPPASTAGTSGSAPSSSSTTSSQSGQGTSSTPSDLLGLPSNVLSLLQETSPDSSNSLLTSALFDSSSAASSNPLSGLYATLLYNQTQTLPYQSAIAAVQTPPAVISASLPNAIQSYNNVLNANNQTLLQNAQAALAANNGALPLTA